MNPRITISLPCYLRPKRTIRAIQSILDQTLNNWELLITGDKCPHFEDEEFIYFMDSAKRQAVNNGNFIHCENSHFHMGAWGTSIRNYHISIASGIWFMFMSNDDVLLPNHLEVQRDFVNFKGLDFAYFDTYVEPNNCPRNAQLKEAMIGHGELLCRTAFLQTMPVHEPFYGHDWKLVQDMMKATTKYEKGVNLPQTYIVKSIQGKRETGID